MKVNIGPYINWFGPHQMAESVFFWLEKYPEDDLTESRIYKLRDWFTEFLAGKNNESKLHKFCNWVHEHRRRRQRVKLDYYDHWNANHTMALIILPLLKKLKENKHGSPDVDFADVPDHLWPSQPATHNNNYTDDTIHERWVWVLDEIIWTFEQEVDEDDEKSFYDHSLSSDPNDDLMTQVGKIKVDREGLEAHHERKTNGFRLFGKYYQGLWD
jgi:hypothetical protein